MSSEKKSKKKCKGEVGYIDYMKKRELLLSILSFGIAAFIFILGLVLNNFEKGNVFTIAAALAVIPAAKILTSFIMFVPYHSVAEDKYAVVKDAMKPGSILYSDLVITSTQKAMNLAFMVITSDKILILTGREKEDPAGIQEYVGGAVRRRGCDFKVTVTADEKKYISLLKNSDSPAALEFENDEAKAAFDAEREDLCSMLESLML